MRLWAPETWEASGATGCRPSRRFLYVSKSFYKISVKNHLTIVVITRTYVVVKNVTQPLEKPDVSPFLCPNQRLNMPVTNRGMEFVVVTTPCVGCAKQNDVD